MWTAILLAAASMVAADPCPCGPGCCCVGECYCVGAVKAVAGDELPGLGAGRQLAERCGCDLVCYVGTSPAKLGPRRPHCVYCACKAIDCRDGAGVVTARWQDGQLGDWRWSRRQDAAEISSMLDPAPAPEPATSPVIWQPPMMPMIPPPMMFGGGCCGGGCCGGG